MTLCDLSTFRTKLFNLNVRNLLEINARASSSAGIFSVLKTKKIVLIKRQTPNQKKNLRETARGSKARKIMLIFMPAFLATLMNNLTNQFYEKNMYNYIYCGNLYLFF